MKKNLLLSVIIFATFSIFSLSCEKDCDLPVTPYELDVILHGTYNKSGHGKNNPSGFIRFRQNPDPDQIVDLGIWVRNLDPNRKYQLQRAVDPANVVDGNCTSTTWLTLGYGLDPKSILIDKWGNGKEDLWRSVATVPAGSTFDIHFQVVEENTTKVVLTSDCYQYTVR